MARIKGWDVKGDNVPMLMQDRKQLLHFSFKKLTKHPTTAYKTHMCTNYTILYALGHHRQHRRSLGHGTLYNHRGSWQR